MKWLEVFHKPAMGIIFLGSLTLLYFAFVWFSRGNQIMGLGMLIMGLVAGSNFYLHLRMMKHSKKK